jgi:hypothetical protein
MTKEEFLTSSELYKSFPCFGRMKLLKLFDVSPVPKVGQRWGYLFDEMEIIYICTKVFSDGSYYYSKHELGRGIFTVIGLYDVELIND